MVDDDRVAVDHVHALGAIGAAKAGPISAETRKSSRIAGIRPKWSPRRALRWLQVRRRLLAGLPVGLNLEGNFHAFS